METVADDATLSTAMTLLMFIIPTAISTVALTVSIRSNRISTKIGAQTYRSNAERNDIARRQLKAPVHDKFADVLRTTETQLAEPLTVLCQSAQETLVELSNLFARYQIEGDGKRWQEWISHVYPHVCATAAAAFTPRVLHWSDSSIHRRLKFFNSFECEIEPAAEFTGKLEMVLHNRTFPKRSRVAWLWRQESPQKTQKLERELRELCNRVRASGRGEMFIEGRALCHEYLTRFAAIEPLIEQNLAVLNDLLSINQTQAVKLNERDDIYNSCVQTINKLKFLAECGLNTFEMIEPRNSAGVVSHFVYVGVVLSIVAEYRHLEMNSPH